MAQAAGLSDLRTRARTLIGESRSLTRTRSQQCNIVISLRLRKLCGLSQFRRSLIHIQESRRWHALDDIVAYVQLLAEFAPAHERRREQTDGDRETERTSVWNILKNV